jgi:hypothetical protein
MGDCRLCSLVFCHGHSAQIVELSWPAGLRASAERCEAELGSRECATPRRLFRSAEETRSFAVFIVKGDEHSEPDSRKPVQD